MNGFCGHWRFDRMAAEASRGRVELCIKPHQAASHHCFLGDRSPWE